MDPPDPPRSALEADRAGRGVRTLLWAVLGVAMLAALAYAVLT